MEGIRIKSGPRPWMYRFSLFVWILLLFGLMLLFMHYVLHDQAANMGDAAFYWELSESFHSSGTFSLLTYPETIRGYFFPFVIFISSSIGKVLFGDGSFGYSLINIAMLAALIVYVFPSLFNVKLSGKRGFIASTVFAIIIFIMWRWLLMERLSDGWALFFAALSVLFLKISKDKVKVHAVIFIVLSGICAYAAYNIRTIYLFLILAIAILVIIQSFALVKKAGAKHHIFRILPFLLGICLIGLPQVMINYNIYNTLDILVDNHGLFWSQITAGLEIEI